MARLHRCGWVKQDSPAYVDYHDREWGVPIHEDRLHFELLILEGAQAGLSWETILNKRSSYREAFAGFEPAAVASFSAADQRRLLANEGIVRNRLKIAAAIANARCFLKLAEQFGSFDSYIWRFVDGEARQNRWRSLSDLPAQTEESAAMSRDLKARGMKFVGPTICYSYMQAAGLVNDHVVGCFRQAECARLGRRTK